MITRKFESCFKQRNESTVNAGDSGPGRNVFLSMGIPVKRGFPEFLEGALTVAIDGGVTMRARREPRGRVLCGDLPAGQVAAAFALAGASAPA